MTMRKALLGILLLAAPNAHAAALHVLTGGATLEVEKTLGSEFTKQTGTSITFDTGTAGQVQQKVEAGDMADVIVASAAVIDTLDKEGRLKAGTKTMLVRAGIGVAARAGAPKPDISTPDKFRAAMLAAKSVIYTDPASGASSGIATAHVFERLGIAGQMAGKTRVQPGGLTAERVASGEIELAIQNISELIPVKGVVVVGPLPAELQTYTTYSAGVGAKSSDAKAAQAFGGELENGRARTCAD
jgi:molybdate transport system substrate-binding protein